MPQHDPRHDESLYLPNDPQFQQVQLEALDELAAYNRLKPSDLAGRTAKLQQMFAAFGANSYVEIPFHANFGGHHVHFGEGVYANFNLTLVDDTHIYVGDHTMFGPNVTLASAAHPLAPELRAQGYQYNKAIHIGRNCWLGAGVIVVPGVSIGDNTVIGAGSIVTKDIPANVIAYGNPCRVQRTLTDEDRRVYDHDKPIHLA